ncbi:MAG: FlgO family outer membrane protein [Pseudomonadota bacterium]|nr:FlgO family outer membrane protein [Pseudomonadota bacterium]
MVKKIALKWLVVGLFLMFLTACAGNEKVCEPMLPVEPEAETALINDPGYDEAAVFESLMDRIMVDLRANFLDQGLMSDENRKADAKFLYSAFVGEDNYDVTTPLGRMMGDALASRMQNDGLQIIEVRLSRSMRIHKKFGMLAMSQDMQKLFSEHQATFMITGSYTVTPHYVYVLARVIGNTSQVIYASSGVWLPRSSMVNYLLDYRQPTVKVVAAD